MPEKLLASLDGKVMPSISPAVNSIIDKNQRMLIRINPGNYKKKESSGYPEVYLENGNFPSSINEIVYVGKETGYIGVSSYGHTGCEYVKTFTGDPKYLGFLIIVGSYRNENDASKNTSFELSSGEVKRLTTYLANDNSIYGVPYAISGFSFPLSMHVKIDTGSNSTPEGIKVFGIL